MNDSQLGMTTTVSDDAVTSAPPPRDRRDLLALLGGALGALSLAACGQQGQGEQLQTTVQGLSGTPTMQYADVISDLRSLAGSASTIAILKGAATIYDGGGGLFIWSSTAAQDDGWNVLNLGAGSGAGWRRVAGDVISVPNVPALRSTIGVAGALAVLQGYSAAGDGGGGLFTWSTTALADDGGTILNSASGSSAGWRRIFSGGLDVKWFGAKGDNSTADDAAIQRTIEAAYSADPYVVQNTGRTVLLSAGIYQLANPLVIAMNTAMANAANGLIFQGEGWHSVLVPRAGVAAALIVTFGWSVLRDFSVQGVAKSGGTAAGIVFKRAVGSQVTNVYINACAGDGMLFDNNYPTTPMYTGNNDTVTVNSCSITNCGGYGIQLQGGPDNNGISFRTCIVQSNARAGLLIRGNCNRVEGGDWSYNGTYGIQLSDPTDSSISVGNVLLYPYTDSMVNTVYNSGKAQRNTILLGYGTGTGTNPTWSGLANVAQNDMVIAPDLANSQGAGLAIVTGNSNPSKGLKITAAPGLPTTQVYAEGDPTQALWLYSKGSGGIVLGFYADPFQAQFCKTLGVSGLTIPAGGTASFVGTVGNNLYSPVSVKVGDIALASFGSVLPAGVFIRNSEVTGPATVTVTFQNTSASAQTLNGYVRIQVTVY